MRTILATPKASMLIESMRDIGYSLETALADVIDNSITAGCKRIEIFAEPFEDGVKIGILDDGIGMSEDQLLDAMRPGSRSPLDKRTLADLGRFGLGLKTASFSQCRRMTVVTRHKGSTSAAIWDLDHVAKTDDWEVQIPDDVSTIIWSDRLPKQGTLVLWENLDRLVDGETTAKELTRFTKRMDEASDHIQLVFHRYLAGEKDLKKVKIDINGRTLIPFDPFHSAHPATMKEPAEPEVIKLGKQLVTVQTFTLPHHTKVTPSEWDKYAGPGGYVKNQGFYVYRQKRLIIHGTWFGMARQSELTKLARVKIDIPNGLDALWKIDVRKASAQPPYQVRERLLRIIERISGTSKRVYTHRGRRLTSDVRFPVWNRVQSKNQIIYRINTEHPAIESYFARLPKELSAEFHRLIELVDASLPVDSLYTDLNQDAEKVSGSNISDKALELAVSSTVQKLLLENISTAEVHEMLSGAEPFRSNWDRASDMINLITARD